MNERTNERTTDHRKIRDPLRRCCLFGCLVDRHAAIEHRLVERATCCQMWISHGVHRMSEATLPTNVSGILSGSFDGRPVSKAMLRLPCLSLEPFPPGKRLTSSAHPANSSWPTHIDAKARPGNQRDVEKYYEPGMWQPTTYRMPDRSRMCMSGAPDAVYAKPVHRHMW